MLKTEGLTTLNKVNDLRWCLFVLDLTCIDMVWRKLLQFHSCGYLLHGDKFRLCFIHVWPLYSSSSSLINRSMGSALEGCLIALAATGPSLLAHPVYQFFAGL